MHARRTTSPHPRPAFTLIELVAVIVVLSVVAVAATMHTASTSATARLQWAARQVAKDLSFARERALSTGTTHWVRFDTAGQYYAVLADNPASPGYAGAATITDPATQSPLVTNLDRGNWSGITVATGGTFSSINYTIGFNKLGRPLSTSGAPSNVPTGPTLQVTAGAPGAAFAAGTANATTITITPGSGRIIY
ncbi:MAG: prepilin-type N-terminal cleavage/methylation domain-containing protein [Phycisphaerales bacterium]|nr:prepilin-type N-terminal cleavage/methylation domain-containing protein [Phycisphaerales bacterium]